MLFRSLAIAHVDCDAFYAAIEKRDDPTLIDRPLIIGGGRRGVVATACYLARVSGVHSAMPMFAALKACPDAVVLRPDMAKYARVGREVRQMMRDLTPMVEPLSIDEAFLDLSGTARLHGTSPALTLVRFARRVEAEIGITVSVGLSGAKFLAKIASDLDKPRGFSILGPGEAQAFLAGRKVGILPGVGPASQARLAKLGVAKVGDLIRVDPDRLHAAIGRDAGRLLALARGMDSRAVRPERETKGVSAETTLHVDLSAFADLRPILWRQCERVSQRLKRAELAATSVTLKLKDSEFRIRSRSRAGLSVEIGNTDAEGRLILADALALADSETPDLLIDFATLTGAARVALGPDLPAFFTEDDSLAEAVMASAKAAIDPVWRMPLHAPYASLLESKVADLNNVSGGPFAGAITAALFLRRFAPKTKAHIHFDLYGWNPTTKPGRPEGGEVQTARLVFDLIKRRWPKWA